MTDEDLKLMPKDTQHKPQDVSSADLRNLLFPFSQKGKMAGNENEAD